MNKEEKIRLFDAVEKINDRLNALDIIATKQEINLSEHMKRTALAEESIGLLREEMKPIQKHVYYIEAVFKALGVASILASLVVSLFKIFSYIL